jgi:hypothetical protein
VTRELGTFKTSMLVDAERGRPIELDAIVTAVHELGKRTGVATPNIDGLLGLTRLFAQSRDSTPATIGSSLLAPAPGRDRIAARLRPDPVRLEAVGGHRPVRFRAVPAIDDLEAAHDVEVVEPAALVLAAPHRSRMAAVVDEQRDVGRTPERVAGASQILSDPSAMRLSSGVVRLAIAAGRRPAWRRPDFPRTPG